MVQSFFRFCTYNFAADFPFSRLILVHHDPYVKYSNQACEWRRKNTGYSEYKLGTCEAVHSMRSRSNAIV